MTVLIVCAVIVVIGLVVRGVRAANRRQQVAGYEEYARSAAPAFPIAEGENVLLSLAARDLGAARRLENDAIRDDYPGSFPLVVCTDTRLVVQMSVTDRTTDLAGSYPPRRPDLSHRIGEQFSGADRRVSSCYWPWETIDSIVSDSSSAGLTWTDERGAGAVMLGFLTPADQQRFLACALSAVTAARTRLGMLPASAVRTVDGSVTDTFAGARVECSACGAVIDSGDRFCTGCGAHIVRLEAA